MDCETKTLRLRGGFVLLGLDALLAGDGLLLALAGAGVAAGALATGRETLAVAVAAVGADVLEPLDVLLGLAAQGALDQVVAVDDRVDRGQLLLTDFGGALVRIDLGLFQD